jgi:predicted metal-dependent phosphoesterase TrpH
VVRAAKDLGLEGIVITEHHRLWSERELAELGEWAGPGLAIFSGVEVSCFDEGVHQGDYIVLGAPAQSRYPRNPTDLIDWAHSEGAIIWAAHPYRYNWGCFDLVYELAIDAIEVWHPLHDEEQEGWAREAAETLGAPQLAVSDAHVPELVGINAINTNESVQELAQLIEAIKTDAFTPLPQFGITQRQAARKRGLC